MNLDSCLPILIQYSGGCSHESSCGMQRIGVMWEWKVRLHNEFFATRFYLRDIDIAMGHAIWNIDYKWAALTTFKPISPF